LPTQPARAAHRPIRKITVRVVVGKDRMAATDDPVFLRLLGPSGREFRLELAHGRSMRRGAEDFFVLGPADDPETNVAHAGLNDPTNPPLDLAGIDHVSLWKRMEPLPNVRGMGEMDDRLEIEEIEVAIHTEDRAEPTRYFRSGPLWLGLICGQTIDLAPVDESS
jgi:hypothetical protein